MQADLDDAAVFDLGPRPLRAASNDREAVAWVRAHVDAAPVLTADDPRLADEDVELVAATLGVPAPNRRSRHRLLDHFGNLWWSTFDRDEATAALARAVTERAAMAKGGVWLTLPVLVPLDPVGSGPPPAVLLHPWMSRSLDRLIPLLRRAGVAVHPSPHVRLDPATGRLPVAPAPAPIGVAPLPTELRPVALAGTWTELRRAEALTWFGHAAARWDQAHLDAVDQLTRQPGYAPIDPSAGARSVAAQLAALLAGG